MSKKVVNKKIIVVTNFNNQTEAALGNTFNKYQNGGATNAPPGLTLSPTPAAVQKASLCFITHRA